MGKAQRADEDLRETAWAPSVETAPVHPELMAQSYRNVRRVQQLQDTAQLAYEAQESRSMSKNRRQSKRERSKEMQSSYALSDGTGGATSVSSQGVIMSDKGDMISYDKNSYKDAHLMMRKQKPQASFSALQVRTELDSAAF